MTKTWKTYTCALALVTLLVSLAAIGCEEESNCFYQCEDGMIGALDGIEDKATCAEEAEAECDAADEGPVLRAEFVDECEEADEDDEADAEDDACVPDWYEDAEIYDVLPVGL